MIINYRDKYEELFCKIYILKNATEKDKELCSKLSQWYLNDDDDDTFDEEVDE